MNYKDAIGEAYGHAEDARRNFEKALLEYVSAGRTGTTALEALAVAQRNQVQHSFWVQAYDTLRGVRDDEMWSKL